jgi:pSer/pThr/pTyr-binding forkhead associated (FHA) protein
MRIEILVDNEEPRIYSLDRPKIMVGSHESCDIVINHKGISRKHLLITGKDEKYFVADQGSTNGSYINEHRLVPGNAAEFSSFFPVRLGDNVLMSLLSDEDAQDLGPDSDFNTQLGSAPQEREESTKMISLKDLSKSSTAGLVKKRTETVTKRKIAKKALAPPKKEHASNAMMGFIGFLIVAGAGYYQFFLREVEVIVDPTKIEKKVEVVVVDDRPIKRVDDTNLPTPEAILAVLKNPKCSTDFEKNFCLDLPLVYQEKSGTVIYNKTIVLVADGLKYQTEAQAYAKPPKSLDLGGTQAEWDAYQIDLNLMMLVLWMKENIPAEPKETAGINDFTIVVAFADVKSEPAVLISASALVPESFYRLRKRFQDKHFIDAKKNGAPEFSYAIEYLRYL